MDHNIVTLDGQGTFHGMGIIAVCTKTSRSDENYFNEERILRMKRVRAGEIIKNRGIKIQLYCSPEKPGLSSISFKSKKQLQTPFTLPLSLNLDLLWSSSW